VVFVRIASVLTGALVTMMARWLAFRRKAADPRRLPPPHMAAAPLFAPTPMCLWKY
jgi:hypothetical protein